MIIKSKDFGPNKSNHLYVVDIMEKVVEEKWLVAPTTVCKKKGEFFAINLCNPATPIVYFQLWANVLLWIDEMDNPVFDFEEWETIYLTVEDAFVNYDAASTEELNEKMLDDGWRWDLYKGKYYRQVKK
jgi:hypothetical protein